MAFGGTGQTVWGMYEYEGVVAEGNYTNLETRRWLVGGLRIPWVSTDRTNGYDFEERAMDLLHDHV